MGKKQKKKNPCLGKTSFLPISPAQLHSKHFSSPCVLAACYIQSLHWGNSRCREGCGHFIAVSLWHSFLLMFFLCSSMGSPQAEILSCKSASAWVLHRLQFLWEFLHLLWRFSTGSLQAAGNICSGVDLPQVAGNICSTMEHLLLLSCFSLAFILSSCACPVDIYCPFLNMFSQSHPELC